MTVAVAFSVATAAELQWRLRARERHALQLEARLSEARLQALSSQLHPHFLFNTLSAISTLVHRDAAAADAALNDLAQLMRAVLRNAGSNEIPLHEETALLQRYVDIMRLRHGERLSVGIDVPEELDDLLVPAFLLQPLVENAIEHGAMRRAGPGTVTVRAMAAPPGLLVTITDDGPGPGTDHGEDEGRGVGLANTRRRLEQLYGTGARLKLEAVAPTGTRAVIEMPARRRSSAATA